MNELKWFFIALLGLWILWVASGGYSDTDNKYKPLLHQPAPIENGQPYSVKDLKNNSD